MNNGGVFKIARLVPKQISKCGVGRGVSQSAGDGKQLVQSAIATSINTLQRGLSKYVANLSALHVKIY